VTAVQIPGSKSITARALFLAASAPGTSVLDRPLVSNDTEAFAEGLKTLGYSIERDERSWTITGNAGGPPAGSASIYCRDGATPARFLPTLAASGHGTYEFDASAQMRRRPMQPLTDALTALGCTITFHDQAGHHPFRLTTDGIVGGEITVDAGLSSQYLTALLMLGPHTSKGLTLQVTELVSRPYIDITCAMMSAFGVDVDHDGYTFVVPPSAYRPTRFAVEPDASTASYFFALAALLGQQISVTGLGSDSAQGDLQFVRVLERMGAHVEQSTEQTTVTGSDQLHGITVNMRDISDTMPTLAAIAPFADSPTRIEDVYNTRVKECDRIDACAENLQRMGIRVETGRDWIQIWPGRPSPVTISCRGDHRIAMAFSIAGLAIPGGVELDDPGCVRKTFPGFHSALAELLGRLALR
jgi:3-phosphoshikimate 1-carboxyvinyltransferase